MIEIGVSMGLPSKDIKSIYSLGPEKKIGTGQIPLVDTNTQLNPNFISSSMSMHFRFICMHKLEHPVKKKKKNKNLD